MSKFNESLCLHNLSNGEFCTKCGAVSHENVNLLNL